MYIEFVLPGVKLTAVIISGAWAHSRTAPSGMISQTLIRRSKQPVIKNLSCNGWKSTDVNISGCTNFNNISDFEICHRRTVLSVDADNMNWDFDHAISTMSLSWPILI